MLGNQIKMYLDQKGIKQKFISDKSKIPIGRLNDVLNEKSPLKVHEYFLICDTLGVSLDYFRNSDEPKTA